GGSDFRDRLLLPSTALTAGFLMMLLDIVIDPLTLLGDRWFLGKVYDYPTGGSYFGVTFANFAGWFFVGSVIPLLFQIFSRFPIFHSSRWRVPTRLEILGVFGVYAGVFLFNLGITAWIGEWRLLAASLCIVTATLSLCTFGLKK